MRLFERFRRSQSGAAMVEFAVVAPVLIFLVIGLVEVGRYMYFGIEAAHAAEAGAVYGSQTITTSKDQPGMQSAAENDSSGITWTSVTGTQVCPATGPSLMGSLNTTSCPTTAFSTISPSTTTYYVKVTVQGTFKSMLNYPGIPTNIPVTATSIMRVAVQ